MAVSTSLYGSRSIGPLTETTLSISMFLIQPLFKSIYTYNQQLGNSWNIEMGLEQKSTKFMTAFRHMLWIQSLLCMPNMLQRSRFEPLPTDNHTCAGKYLCGERIQDLRANKLLHPHPTPSVILDIVQCYSFTGSTFIDLCMFILYVSLHHQPCCTYLILLILVMDITQV